jgi:hypothetical protein
MIIYSDIVKWINYYEWSNLFIKINETIFSLVFSSPSHRYKILNQTWRYRTIFDDNQKSNQIVTEHTPELTVESEGRVMGEIFWMTINVDMQNTNNTHFSKYRSYDQSFY